MYRVNAAMLTTGSEAERAKTAMNCSPIRELILIAAICLLAAGCASKPPARQDNICEILEHEPKWYDYARRSEERWGVPIPVQIAFVQRESAFRARARPARDRLFGVIPWRRPSSARGYAQAQDPAWRDYRKATGRRFASRADMADALDFIGWYNDVSHRRLGLSRDDAYSLYLAYHEGHGGYRRETWRGKPEVRRTASQVARRAEAYRQQLPQCEDDLRCHRWYQFWPFCR